MWKIIKTKVDEWDRDSWILLIIWVFIMCIFYVIFNAANSDKMVRCYYLHASPLVSGVMYNIKADIDYSVDPLAFSSVYSVETLRVFEKLPQCPTK